MEEDEVKSPREDKVVKATNGDVSRNARAEEAREREAIKLEVRSRILMVFGKRRAGVYQLQNVELFVLSHHVDFKMLGI